MKKYTIHYNYYATADVEVLANSEEEAIKKAREVDIPTKDYDLTLNEESVINSEDVPDLPTLIEEAEHILKEADDRGKSFELTPWLHVTVQVWDGEKMNPVTQRMETVFYDDDREEIGIETEYTSELTISDILEIQQLNLCLAIIAQAEQNGIKL